MNDLTGYQSVIGGALAPSKNTSLWFRPRPVYSGQTAPPPPPTPGQLVDVENWQTAHSYEEQAAAVSGSLGADRSRRIGYSFAWSCDVLLDFTNAPEPQAMDSGGVSIFFQIAEGQELPIDPAEGPVLDKYLWLPFAKLVSATPLADAAARKKVRQHLVGSANSWLIPLSDFSDLGNTATTAGAYWAFLYRVFVG